MLEVGNITERIKVEIDRDLEEIIPGFLENRVKDIAGLKAAAQSGDFEYIRIIGHTLKGIGGGYGFDRISELGMVLEQAAKDGQSTIISKAISDLEVYLELVEIIYI